MSLVNFAKDELDRLFGENPEDMMNEAMKYHILHMVEEFSKVGHSGFSAEYAIGVLEKLLRFQPLMPLTGEDDEWTDVSDMSGRTMYQNKRCPTVFKDETGTYDINAAIFIDKEGNAFTSSESRRDITFPYTPTVQYFYEE